PGRSDLDPSRVALAQRTNPDGRTGTADELLRGADVYIGVSAPGAVSAAAVATMAPRAIVFAMANPTPEVHPEEIVEDAAIVATGRSDYPNQINNVLAFPGVFRGLLDARASEITVDMLLRAAEAIALVVKDDELNPNFIIPTVFHPDVPKAVAAAIRGITHD
ncbi:MAG TPA: malic enzyme-like NAD(P)-binding protein, partial [Acidimicrobiia bacterium]